MAGDPLWRLGVKPWLLSFLVCALASAAFAGCAKSSQTAKDAQTSEASPGVLSLSGDTAAGKEVFVRNCSACHGATGTEGGIGPSLHNEKARKNYVQTVAWIKNPQPPMPKLYPAPLGEKDVDDAAAYVQSL
jgi:mono/diheme cytochrome c family protein